MRENLFTQIAEFQFTSEAHILKGKLEAAGVEVFMRDSHTIDADPLMSQALGGVKLFVHTTEMEKAREILTDIHLFPVTDEAECAKCSKDKLELPVFKRLLYDLFPFFATTPPCPNCPKKTT